VAGPHRFVVEEEPKPTPGDAPTAASLIANAVAHEIDAVIQEIQEERRAGVPAPEAPLAAEDHDSASWRDEVAARLNQYRARRRPREPRYPSLQLKFEASAMEWEGWTAPEDRPPMPASRQSVALDAATSAFPENSVSAERIAPRQESVPETSARILEFPRSSSTPPMRLDELAEPVFDRPRILDVPEVEPPPPALGGILIEPVETEQEEKRPGIDMPLQAAPMWRRVAAGAVDGVIVAAAVALFGYIFLRIAVELPSRLQAVSVILALTAAFWVGYQYLLVVYSGTTPGLRLARLRLCRFDGDLAPRRLRRWRILASILSGAAAGLGYGWCFLDEDRLCWHDRITHTYMAPTKSSRK